MKFVNTLSSSLSALALLTVLCATPASAHHQGDWDPSEDVINPLERLGESNDTTEDSNTAGLVAVCGGSIEVTEKNGVYYADGRRLAKGELQFNRSTWTGVLRLGPGGPVLTCVAPM